MPLRTIRSIVAPILTLLACTAAVRAAVPNRISAISESDRSSLGHMVPGPARRSADLGQAPLNRVMPSVTLHFNMSPAQLTALNQLTIDQQNPDSPRFHQWLTPAQYGAQFGLSSSDLAKVSAWLTGRGLKITAVAPSSNFITVSGTVAQIQAALGTSIHQLSLDGEPHISNLADPVLPSALAGVVSGITGLNDFRLKSRAQARTVVQPNFTSSISGNHFIAPGDFYTIYDVAPLLASSINGSGVTIAIMGQTDISLPDAAAFRSASGLPANPPAVKLFGADPGTTVGDLREAMLDVEWAGAVAPAASILYVNSKDVVGLSLINAITSNLAPIISISYGSCESDWGQANLTTLNRYFQQANALGQTIVGPSGDSGATDCDFQTTQAVTGLAVDFPASSPFVTAAGGTTFNEGSGSFWNSGNGTNSGSATGYIPEAVWNESGSGGLASGGGGASAFFSKPAWQVGSGVPADLSRDVPDIALNSAGSHVGYLYCVQGSCVTGFRGADGQTLSVVGGTSAAAPGFAGILALVEQKIGGRIGNANPQIYGLANSTFYNNAFHDITSGNNNSTCIQGSPNCPSGGSIGYSAGPGYDLATGWGTIDAYNLVTKWGLVASSGVASSIGSAITSTTLTTFSAPCGIASGSLALSVAVASAVTGSPVPTGIVQMLVDNVATGSPIALNSGSASYTLSTSSLSSGGHTVSAVYLGDANFGGSKGSLLTDVVSSTQPDFSVTPCTPSTTAPPGGNATGITFTVNPFNGFTGPVTFTAVADVTLAGSYSFSITPVVITGTSGSPTVFTLSAYVTNGKASNGRVRLTSNNNRSEMGSTGLHGLRSVYVAGSGTALASILLLTVPRRRRWGALLAVVLSIGALGANGCGSGSSAINASNVPSTTPAASGTYNVTVVGSGTTASGNRIHSTQVTFVVQ